MKNGIIGNHKSKPCRSNWTSINFNDVPMTFCFLRYFCRSLKLDYAYFPRLTNSQEMQYRFEKQGLENERYLTDLRISAIFFSRKHDKNF